MSKFRFSNLRELPWYLGVNFTTTTNDALNSYIALCNYWCCCCIWNYVSITGDKPRVLLLVPDRQPHVLWCARSPQQSIVLSHRRSLNNNSDELLNTGKYLHHQVSCSVSPPHCWIQLSQISASQTTKKKVVCLVKFGFNICYCLRVIFRHRVGTHQIRHAVTKLTAWSEQNV